ncbi:MAG: AAA family ATPase, partial [Bacteroidota bacterium]|nr:AAA family ATPase [Bacteroidota bacterium]
GSSILVLGSAGTGKTSIASSFALKCAQSGKKCLYFAFEESPNQIIRNMDSIGIPLKQHIQSGMLQFYASRPTVYGLEMHLVIMNKAIEKFEPEVVIVDPMTNMISIGSNTEIKTMLTRLMDNLKNKQITGLFTSLVHGQGKDMELTTEGISSLIDTLLEVRNIELNNEMRRGLQIVKSRGMAHSNKIREFLINDKGIDLLDFQERVI